MELYHIYNRGNHKEQICFDSKDLNVLKKMFLELIGSSKKASLISLCIMPNHYHVLVAIKKRKDLSVWMREIGRNYTIYMNRKYSLVGRIFLSISEKED